VTPVYLFELASRHISWASLRQMAITSNIANANTTGYEAQEIQPFADVLDSPDLVMAATAPGHIGIGAGDRGGSAGAAVGNWEIAGSGAPVSLDQELVKADEVSRSISLDTGIERAFHRMLLSAVRTGA
jgi:flagellar basal-body rod protein FlgB